MCFVRERPSSPWAPPQIHTSTHHACQVRMYDKKSKVHSVGHYDLRCVRVTLVACFQILVLDREHSTFFFWTGVLCFVWKRPSAPWAPPQRHARNTPYISYQVCRRKIKTLTGSVTTTLTSCTFHTYVCLRHTHWNDRREPARDQHNKTNIAHTITTPIPST